VKGGWASHPRQFAGIAAAPAAAVGRVLAGVAAVARAAAGSLDQFWSKRLGSSRKGTRWDQVLFVLVAYSLLAGGQQVAAAPRVVSAQRPGRGCRGRGCRARPKSISRAILGSEERGPGNREAATKSIRQLPPSVPSEFFSEKIKEDLSSAKRHDH